LEIFLGRKGFYSLTPYKHCLVYHALFFTKKYRKLLRFSGQGVEKINDDIKKKCIIQKQTNGTQRSMPYKFEKG
jgi:hypothetical protein